MTRKQRNQQPIRHPFIEIAGDIYLILEWFEVNANEKDRDTLTLARMTRSELRLYDRVTTMMESVGYVLPRVRKRLGYRYPNLHGELRR